jgi:hypothetical protein
MGANMKVSLTITTTIPAREKLTVDRVLSLAQELLPGKDFVRVEGGKYTYLVVWEDRKDEYGEWVAYRIGRCEKCGKDVFGSAPYCDVCRQWRLENDNTYYSVEGIVRMAEKARKITGVGLMKEER